jgi:hypothetical protein
MASHGRRLRVLTAMATEVINWPNESTTPDKATRSRSADSELLEVSRVAPVGGRAC